MATTNKKYIELRQQRDFGQVISTSFEFLFANFAGFFKTVFLITGLTFVLSISLFSLWLYKFINGVSEGVRATRYGRQSSSDALMTMFGGMNLLYLILGGVVLIFSLMFTYLTVYSYIKIYVNNRKLMDISIGDVWNEVKKRLPKYIGGGILFVIIVTLLNALSVALDSVGFLQFIIGLFTNAFIIYTYLYFLVLVNEEDVSVLDAFGRSFYLVSGRWWFTFGIFFVLFLLCYILTLLLSFTGIFIGGLVSNFFGYAVSKYITFLLVITGSVLGTIYLYMVFCFFIIKNSVLYYSYSEQKDSIGLLENIEALVTQTTQEPSQAVRTERSNQQFTNDETEEEF